MMEDGYRSYDTGRFSRTVSNERKMGAYYTDLGHCRDIARMFLWPDEEVCVLEPSIGDGSAAVTVTKAAENPRIKIFGVELNDETARETAKNPLIHALVHADFLDGFVSRRDAFSFCFANPPYLSQKDDTGYGTKRSEREFLDKIGDYLRHDALIVWVVPLRVFFDEAHVRTWIRDYETLQVFKFRGKEYERFHQVVAVGRKRRHGFVQKEEIRAFIDSWKETGVPELPDDLPPCVRVMPSAGDKIDLFTTKVFDPELARDWLEKKGLGADLTRAFTEGITQTPYQPLSLGRPPIPLKKDSEYLLLTSGFTDGLVGSESEGNLHLMRGVANVVEHQRIDTTVNEETDEVTSSRLIVTTSTEVEVRIIESSGRIRLLGDKNDHD